MSWVYALLLGLLQAITEFFPISSSAHLKLFKHFTGLEGWDAFVLFDLSCHLGTLVAVIYFLRGEIKELLVKKPNKLGLFFLALVPLIPCYFLLKPLREWVSQKEYMGFCLMITGAILFAGHYIRISPLQPIGSSKRLRDILYIGSMQSVALIPGISRSASTISCARILGWDIKDAVRFSFLLSIPTILGGNILELARTLFSTEKVQVEFFPCFVAFISSLFLGLGIVRWAIPLLEKGNLKPFGWYCLFLGIFAILYFNVLGR